MTAVHTGIITIPNTGAQGIYNGYCYPVNVNDRKAGDLIFLKDTYDTGEPGSISHIGIYMGTLTIDGDTDEYVIDTGGNPSGAAGGHPAWKQVRSENPCRKSVFTLYPRNGCDGNRPDRRDRAAGERPDRLYR